MPSGEITIGPVQDPRRYAVFGNATDISYTAAHAEEQAIGYLSAIESAVKGRRLGTSVWQDRYADEVANIKAAHSPKLLVGVLGATGAGKSSLINALLGYDIVPTSGMAACTAVATEISFSKANTFQADIEFLSEDDWRRELTTVLEDLRDKGDAEEGGPVEQKNPAGGKRDNPAAVARAKIRAAYPDITIDAFCGLDVDSILQQSPLVTQLLGSTTRVDVKTPGDLASTLAQYVESREQYIGNALAYWALIRHIKIRCPSPVLSTGLILVDLPGVADSNAARSRIAGDYIQKCDHFWVTAPITRAVNDKTAQELLGRAFRHQLRLDGKLDPKAFTFIATKCDDISSAEIVRDLNLQTNPRYQQIIQEQQRHRDEVAKWKGHEKSAKSATSDIQKSLDSAEAQLSEYKCAVHSALAKRKLPHSLEADMEKCSKRPKVEPLLAGAELMNIPGEAKESSLDESTSLQPLEDGIVLPVPVQDIERLRTRISELQQSSQALLQQSKEARLNMVEADSHWRSSRKELAAFCSLQRSQYSTRRIQEDFRTGLWELGVRTEDDLPVFTVSAREHAALASDGLMESTCFTNVEQTGIPALRGWCHALTLPAREKATHNLLVQLRAFSQSFSAFVEGTPGVTEKDRTVMKQTWESAMHGGSPEYFKNRVWREAKAKRRIAGVTWRLVKDFSEVVTNHVCDLQDAFAEDLGDKCEEGEVRAALRAVQIADEFADSMPWQSFRATLRRDGSYTRGDLNAELLMPFSAHIAESYCEAFRKDFFSTLEDEVIETVERLIQDFVDSIPPYLRVRAKKQGENCIAEARAALKNIVPAVDRTLKDHQPVITRKLTPHVQAQLVDGYRLAMQETGPGSVKRQKTIIHDYVNGKKDMAFKGAAEVLTTGLHEAVASVEDRLNNDLAEVSRTMEKNLAILWEDGPVGEDQIAARLEILKLLDEISRQLDLWLAAKKRRDEPGQVAGSV